jgi:hypothetical protein
MKKTLFFSVLSLIVATTFLSSCSKYDEGSKFTLLSKKSRMVNNWHLISANVDGFEINLSGTSKHLELSKDGSAKYTETYIIFGQTYEGISNGTWEFNDDKSKLVLTETGATVTDDYTIIKLTNSELKVQQIDPSNGDITIQTWETM